MTGRAFPQLSDDVTVLRRWQAKDVSAMLDAFSDPEFERHSDWQPRTQDAAFDYLGALDQGFEKGEQVDFAITQPGAPAVMLGGCSLNGIDLVNRRGSVGYWLSPTGRGRGLATHAVRLVTGWAFDDLGLARVELTCGPDNVGSQRVAERCRFSREGLLRSHVTFKGGRRDTVVFSLLAAPR